MNYSQSERDWLPLGFLTAGVVAGLVALVAAILIRLELQQPGVQYFLDRAGRPDGAIFDKLTTLHGAASTLFCVLPMLFAGLGYVLVPAALGRRTVLRPLGWIALLALAVGLGCVVASVFVDAARTAFPGWVLYLPSSQAEGGFSTSMSLSACGHILGLLSLALVSVDYLVSLFVRSPATVAHGIRLAAWLFALSGAAFFVVVGATLFISLSADEGAVAYRLDGPLNIILVLASLTVLISALRVSFGRGGGNLIVPLVWSLAYFGCVAYGGRLTFDLTQAGFGRGLHDTYYVVAQAHLFVQGASLFALFAGMNAAFPSIGQQVWLGLVQASLMVVGTAMSFMPQAFLGLQGMPRRYMDYPDAFAYWNYVSSLGSFLTAFAIVLWIVILLRACFGKRESERMKEIYD